MFGLCFALLNTFLPCCFLLSRAVVTRTYIVNIIVIYTVNYIVNYTAHTFLSGRLFKPFAILFGEDGWVGVAVTGKDGTALEHLR